MRLLVLVAGAVIAVAGQAAAETGRIVEIRVHGNHTTPDGDILALSGLTIGDADEEIRLREAEAKLQATKRFEWVQVRRRYLSIADPSQILVVIVVNEHPAVSPRTLEPGLVRRLTSRGMWLPVLRYEDGYGLTYGARYSFSNLLGDRSRLSVPMSWGGERRVAVEAERVLDGPVSLVRGGAGIGRRVNPHFELPETRRESWLGVERLFTRWLRGGATARVAQVGFGDAYEARHAAGGLHAVLDTRIDPSFPRNALHVRVRWERLGFQTGHANRWHTDARGYVGAGGRRVLALRALVATSDAALPTAEQVLLGGGDSLRGYRTGHRTGDNLAAGTVEIRQPFDSPLNPARLGVRLFVDAGTTWAVGTRLGDRRFDRGIGGGVYAGIGPVIMNLDVAGASSGRVRSHVGLGLSF